MVVETKEAYRMITKPYIDSIPPENIEWVYNILEQVMMADASLSTGTFSGKAVLLEDVIYNLSVNSDHYKNATLSSPHLLSIQISSITPSAERQPYNGGKITVCWRHIADIFFASPHCTTSSEPHKSSRRNPLSLENDAAGEALGLHAGLAARRGVHARGAAPVLRARDGDRGAQPPLGARARAAVHAVARVAVSLIVHGQDDRLVVVVGPCSIYDVEAAMDYAKRLKVLADELDGELLVIMRTYFEKPRTTVGWKGLINDLDLNQSFNINKGIRVARKLLLDVNSLGLPVSLEFLDTISPQFTSDLISWGAIGARTTESQLHRELTSGLSTPVGFKNGTGGNAKVAVDAAVASSQPHNFLGLNEHGLASIVRTKGIKDCHVILRGGSGGLNYEQKYIDEAAEMLVKAKQPSKIMLPRWHHRRGQQELAGCYDRVEYVEGNQSLGDDPSKLVYGKSITDACINWDDTPTTLKELAAAVSERRKRAAAPPTTN
ncbi:hypothetical protein ON010_g1987 [Phytophthora cinnamomi]|nr:hypothetical protein ON010_g1987 [Phytophthora cinnamomi]